MKTLILLLFTFLFIQCSSDTQDKKDSIVHKIGVDGQMNRDSFYLEERANIKIYLTHTDSSKKIAIVKFFFNDIYLPHTHDTAKASFLVKNLSGYILDTVEYRLKAIFRINNTVDSALSVKRYYVSKALLNKRSEGRIVNGKREGKWKFWQDDNRKYIARISSFKKGLRNGADSLFYDDSNFLSEVRHYKNGVMNGPCIEYWRSGAVLSKGVYKNGVEEGSFIRYSSDGSIIE
jgi:hypothetical protein